MRVVSARYRWVMSACQHSLGMAASKRMKELLGFFFGAGVMSPSFLRMRRIVEVKGRVCRLVVGGRQWFLDLRRVRDG